VFGFVHARAGSLASANYLILKELLRRGCRIDFYVIDGIQGPEALADHPNFHLIAVSHGLCRRVWRWIERVRRDRVRRSLATAFGMVSNWLHFRLMGSRLQARHAKKPYDALLTLGLLSPWKVKGLRCLSWTQGTPNGEGGWLLQNSPTIARHCGLPFLLVLAAVYTLKYLEAFRLHRMSDVIICGSRWAVESWRKFGVARRKLVAIPYPFDLEQFQPVSRPAAGRDPGEFVFLHLGRLVPRKRLDLLLEAFQLLRREKPGVRLLVIGQYTYGRNYKALLEDPHISPGVEYHESVPHADVPKLLARADALIQTSENENFGSAVAEALAAGLPVVVGPTNGTKDYISPTSFVFTRYDRQAVKEGMLRVIDTVRAGGAEVAADARRAAESRLSVPSVMGRLLPLLETMN
jgi:glycosyltransferase involved in cell wall biosynthesis